MSNIPYYIMAVVAILGTFFEPIYAQERVQNVATKESSSIEGVETSLKFERESWNFGDIQEDGGVVEHTFKFINTTATPIVILDVSASCGCTSPHFSRKPIMPNANGEIRVEFDPMNRPGRFSKGVVIALSTKERITLTIEGNVLPRQRTLEESYPFDVGEGVRLSSNFHAFSYLGRGEEVEESIVVYNTSDKDVTFRLRPNKMSNMMHVKSPSLIKAKGLASITLTYKIPENSNYYGTLDDVYKIVVNGKESKVLLSAHAIAVDKFDPSVDDTTIPSCELSKKIIKFGDVKQGVKVENRSVEIVNNSETDLLIRAVEWKSSSLRCSLRAGDKVAAGESCIITLTLDTSDCDYGVWFDRLSIITNDVERPMQSVRITAVVVD
ncbi:MAG: DUF1573 domain-containing protein [Alistipes sp.]|nr:DUF1573 domain-containing protein [Alistipes sp.]